MDTQQRKNHWENIFKSKDTSKVSWYQAVPESSLSLIEKLYLPLDSRIIDVGCGDSCLSNFLLDKGFTDISAIDISAIAIDLSKKKMGEKAKQINWIVDDITSFSTDKKFDIWHDRAVFHFLTDKIDIDNYIQTVSEKISPKGYLIIATFSENGPNQCSGLIVKQYSENEMLRVFGKYFQMIECFTENHQTPSGGSQNFLFCVFRKK